MKSKAKRNPEQELCNRKRIENITLNVATILFIIVGGAVIASLGYLIVSDIYNDWISLSTEEQRNHVLVIALFASSFILFVVLFNNSDRAMELEKIVGSEDTNEE